MGAQAILPYPDASSLGEKGLLVWSRQLSQAGECWASSSSFSVPWLGVMGRALGRHPAPQPSHLLPAKTHWLPLKRLHLKGEVEAKGRQEPGRCPALGSWSPAALWLWRGARTLLGC